MQILLQYATPSVHYGVPNFFYNYTKMSNGITVKLKVSMGVHISNIYVVD